MQKMKALTNSNLFKQMLFAFGILSISRLVWFVANVFWLPPIGIDEYIYAHLVGIYFDIPVVIGLFLPVWIWVIAGHSWRDKFPEINRILFVISSMTVLIFNGIDTGYSQVTAKRSGYELFDILGDDANRFAPYIIDNWYIILVLAAMGHFIYRWVPIRCQYPDINFRMRPLRGLIATLTFTAICLLGFRGGFQLRPLRAIDASKFVQPEIAPLVTSTPLQIISTWKRNGLPNFEFDIQFPANSAITSEPKTSASQHWLFDNSTALSPFPMSRTLGGGWVQPNIVVIVVESLARDYTGFGNGTQFTPYLDRLAADPNTLYFPYCYANGTKSIEMVPSIFCGMPSLMSEFYVTSSYANNKVNNAFQLAKGYKTAFFHGSNNGTMGFQSFLKQTGLQQYHGIDQYPSDLYQRDFDGNWGIFDEPYLQHFIRCMDTMNDGKQPVFASVFTLSSHHPYTIPKPYLNKLPGTPETVQHTIAYADIALQKFFQTAATKPWFNNTVFVITGDHTSHSDKEYFYSQSGHYEVPFLIYAPGIDIKHINEKLNRSEELRNQQLRIQQPQTFANPPRNEWAEIINTATQKTLSQCDIIPTLWNLLGANNPRLGFGRSAFDPNYKGYSTHIDKDLYYIIQYPFVLALDQQGKVVDYHKQLRNNNKSQKLPLEGPQFEWLRATLQCQMTEYSSRIKQNRWE
ncbi:MAG: sulfatase-like hydrolase/transferase [Bacteroidetes bacterium]|nr:sulfatase-like hydrolase/transferase [Bacteroidota bacterium]